MKIAKIFGAILEIAALTLTLVLAWIGFGTCMAVGVGNDNHVLETVAHRMKHPFE